MAFQLGGTNKGRGLVRSEKEAGLEKGKEKKNKEEINEGSRM
jgi:hypothetical protein